jgi:DNA polymerase
MSASATALRGRVRRLEQVRREAGGCRACPLWKDATQTVFGEGPVDAALMLVGEQPGDREDLAGHPFVGPAGRVLRGAMEAAGIAIDDAYVTNAVKHFKFVTRGKRRIHNKPRAIEIRACEPWLEAEIKVVKPAVVVALGATAAQALLGPKFKLTPNRGRVLEGLTLAPAVIATVHPSSILRSPDSASRHRELAKFEDDLRVVAGALEPH